MMSPWKPRFFLLLLPLILLAACSSSQQGTSDETPVQGSGVLATPNATSNPSASASPSPDLGLATTVVPPAKSQTFYFYLSKGGNMPGGIEFQPKCKGGTCAEKSHATYIRDALKDYINLTPIQFVEIPNPPLASDSSDTHHPYIYYADDGDTDLTSGPDDAPANYLPWIKDRDRLVRLAPGSVWTTAPVGPLQSPNGSTMIPLHETGHALGRYHEHARHDRDQYLSVSLCCTNFAHAWDLHSPGPDGYLAPYDPKSIMHYSSESMCIQDPSLPIPNFPGYFKRCVCLPMLSKINDTGFPNDPAYNLQNQPANSSSLNVCPASFAESGYVLQENPGILSIEDINILFLMYPPRLGANAPGSTYGASTVAADFDGDGYVDLAVGAPGAANGSSPHSGLVYVYKGTHMGLVPWRVLDGNSLAPRADGDQFGSSLAAADLDGDGKAELFVGAPGKVVGAHNAPAGAVYVFQGSRTGPVPLGSEIGFYHEENLGNAAEAGDLFGTSLASGIFNGKAGVAVGAPGKNQKAGAVYILQWSGSTPNSFATLGQAQPAGAEFGTSLAAGDVDGDGVSDLVIGAPGSGKAYYFQGTSQGFTGQVTLHRVDKPNAPNFARFGQSVALGRFGSGLPAPRKQIAVGSPGSPGEAGAVWIFRIDPNDSGGFKFTKNVAITGTPNTADGQLGTSLASADLNKDGTDDLVIGAPEANQGLGGVLVYLGSDKISGMSASTPWTSLSEPSGQGNNASGDAFGTALAIGDFNHDGLPDLAVGALNKAAPSTIVTGDTKTSGALYLLQGQSGGNAPITSTNSKTFTNYLDQEFTNPRKL